MLDYLLDQFKKGQQDGLDQQQQQDVYNEPAVNTPNFMEQGQGQGVPSINNFAQRNPTGNVPPSSDPMIAYTQGSNGYNPIRQDPRTGVTNWDSRPMTLDQVAATDRQWDALPVNQNPGNINDVQVIAGSRMGVGSQLPELNRLARQDSVDATNARLGLNPHTNTSQIGTQEGVKDLMNFRSSLDKNDTAAQNATLKSDMTDKWNQLKMDNANEMMRTRFDLMLRNQQERENNKQKGDDPTPGVQMFYTQQDPTKPPIIEEVSTNSPMYQRYMTGDFASKTRPFGKKGQMKANQALSSFKYNPNPVTTTYDNNGKVYGTTVKGSAPQVKPAQPTAQPPTISKEAALAELRRRKRIQ